MGSDHSEPIGQYVLSDPFVVVHFLLPHGELQLCAPLAAQCQPAEQVYHYIQDAKSIPYRFTVGQIVLQGKKFVPLSLWSLD